MRILDLFCGGGGAAMGLHRYFPDAEIVGVDSRRQPRYPFAFKQADAMEYPLAGFDFIWASPPCQGYSVMRHLPWLKAKTYPLLIEPVRERLRGAGVPWIIENVMGARSAKAMDASWLCGTMFGKRFYRHRLFESNFLWLAPPHEQHAIRGGRMLAGRARDIVFAGARGGIDAWRRAGETNGIALGIGHQPGAALARAEMGCEWMSADEMSQAIPPCYSQYLAQFIPVENIERIRESTPTESAETP